MLFIVTISCDVDHVCVWFNHDRHVQSEYCIHRLTSILFSVNNVYALTPSILYGNIGSLHARSIAQKLYTSNRTTEYAFKIQEASG